MIISVLTRHLRANKSSTTHSTSKACTSSLTTRNLSCLKRFWSQKNKASVNPTQGTQREANNLPALASTLLKKFPVIQIISQVRSTVGAQILKGTSIPRIRCGLNSIAISETHIATKLPQTTMISSVPKDNSNLFQN